MAGFGTPVATSVTSWRCCAHCRDGFIWIGLKDPTDAEFDEVNDELALHPLAVEDAVKGNQRAKIEPYEGSILAVLKTLRYLEETSDVETGEVMVFVGDRFVVTVRRGEGNPLRDVRHRLDLNRDPLALGPAVVLRAVMDSVVDNYVLIERALSDDLDNIEQQVFTGAKETDVTAIYRLKREVLEFRRAAYPLAEALGRVSVRTFPDLIDPEVLPFFRDVADHLRPGQRPHRVLRPAAHRHPQRPPHPGHSPAERGRPAHLGLGGHFWPCPPWLPASWDELRVHAELSASVTIGDTEFHWGTSPSWQSSSLRRRPCSSSSAATIGSNPVRRCASLRAGLPTSVIDKGPSAFGGIQLTGLIEGRRVRFRDGQTCAQGHSLGRCTLPSSDGEPDA